MPALPIRCPRCDAVLVDKRSPTHGRPSAWTRPHPDKPATVLIWCDCGQVVEVSHRKLILFAAAS